MEFNRCFPYNSSVMSSGEKYKMVSESNELFVQLMKNLQQVRQRIPLKLFSFLDFFIWKAKNKLESNPSGNKHQHI